MNCNQCGAELQSQEKFCQHCGAAVTEQITPIATAPVMENNSQSSNPSGGFTDAWGTANNNQSANYVDDSPSKPAKPQAKRQSFNLALGGLVVAVIMMIILFAADYVIVAYITFIAPVVSFLNIGKDKKNGHSGFLPTILINIVTLIIAVILFVVYLKAVAA